MKGGVAEVKTTPKLNRKQELLLLKPYYPIVGLGKGAGG